MIFRDKQAIALVFLGLLSSPSFGQASNIQIQNAWSRAAPMGRTGVVFLTIIDTGVADRLVSVASPVAGKAELHETTMDQGVMKMRPVAGLNVTSGQKVTLAPGGYHIMLMNLTQALNECDHVPVVLTFEKAGQISADALVAKPGGGMPMMGQPPRTGG